MGYGKGGGWVISTGGCVQKNGSPVMYVLQEPETWVPKAGDPHCSGLEEYKELPEMKPLNS